MDTGSDDSGNSAGKRRPKAHRPRFEATMEAKRLVPLTVDFYNRLLFSEAFEKAAEAVDRYAAVDPVGAERELGKFLTRWAPPFKGLVS